MHGPSGDVLIADTNNHLVRLVNATGFVFTLAGETRLREKAPDGSPVSRRRPASTFRKNRWGFLFLFFLTNAPPTRR